MDAAVFEIVEVLLGYVLDHLVLLRCKEEVNTHDLPFGYELGDDPFEA